MLGAIASDLTSDKLYSSKYLVRLFLFDKNPELLGSGPFVYFQQ